jgi:ATP-dependent protease ClpP protease subunit
MTNGILQQPQGPIHFLIGFNLVIDRFATMRLMQSVGSALEKGAQSITLLLSSHGGAPEQAFYAYEILRTVPVPLITHNVGTIQSAAMVIFLAGQQRFAVPHAHFLMHQTVHTPVAGSSYGQELLDHSAESIHADDLRAIAIISERTEQPAKTVRRWHAGQKLRSTHFAETHGIIHGIRAVQFPAQSYFFQINL